jgi:hypothetical protein
MLAMICQLAAYVALLTFARKTGRITQILELRVLGNVVGFVI